jgi:pimeloyl-ACP methyl ester carboxylesterase
LNIALKIKAISTLIGTAFPPSSAGFFRALYVMRMYFSTTESFEKCKAVLIETSFSFHAFQGQGNWFDCEHELGFKLNHIHLPVQVVVGMIDFICGPYVSTYLHSELPYSKLLIIENAGHFLWLEQPEYFYKGMREFLPKLNYMPAEQ